MPEARALPPGALERELARAPSLRLALATLLALASAAILAPLLASERPYWLVAVDHWEWKSARRAWSASLAGVEEALARAGETRAQLAQEERAAATRELGAARVQLERLRRQTGEPELLAPLAGLLAGLDQGLRGGAARGELLVLARAAREGARAFEPRLAELETRLVPRASSPLLQALAPSDAAGIVFWLVSLSSFASLVLRGRLPRRPLRRLALAAGLALAVLLAWSFVHEPAEAVRGARIKSGLADGSIAAERVHFAPLAMGYAETHLDEAHAPPSWSGARAPGRVLRARPGEPALGSWWRHPLGTDAAGRDVLARVLWGGRASLAVGFLSALGLVLLGTGIGAAAGFAGGLVDTLASRGIEVVQAFPSLLLVLVVLAFAEPESLPAWLAVALVIAAVGWTSVARLVRAEVLRARGEDWVAALRSLGLSPARILVRHVVPNAAAPALVAFGFALGGGILVESTVSYLGFGIEQPTPSWGGLVAEARSLEHWWLVLFPGLAIFAAALAAHRVGEGLRAALAPRDESGPALAPRDESGPALAPRDESGPALAPRDESGPALARPSSEEPRA